MLTRRCDDNICTVVSVCPPGTLMLHCVPLIQPTPVEGRQRLDGTAHTKYLSHQVCTLSRANNTGCGIADVQ
jgi:hypothetical protein